MSMKQNHNVKNSLRKINPKSPTKKFNSSRKMGRRGENVDAKRSSIDLTVSYSQRSMSLKSINVKKNRRRTNYIMMESTQTVKIPQHCLLRPLNNQDLSTMNKNEKNYGLNYGRGRMRGMIR